MKPSRPWMSLLPLCLATPSAYAYIDPGVGSMLIQGLIAGLAAGAALLRYYWDQVKAFFGRRSQPSEPDQPSDGDT